MTRTQLRKLGVGWGGVSCLNQIQRYLDAFIPVTENVHLFIASVNIRVAR